MKRANRLGCRQVLLFGEDEFQRGMVTLRDMGESTQREVALDQIVAEIAQLPPL